MSLSDVITRELDLPIIGRREYRWPADDNCLWKWAHQVDHINLVLPSVVHRGACVQAGGGCGVWPLALARFFGRVYTFEPFVPNYKALSVNCADALNVISFNAALGDVRRLVGMAWRKGHETNFGAQYTVERPEVPVMRIDDLHLDACGLIILDVEGREDEALHGAEDTIRRLRPAVMIEEAGHGERFGCRYMQARERLQRLGYVALSKTRDDVVMVPLG